MCIHIETLWRKKIRHFEIEQISKFFCEAVRFVTRLIYMGVCDVLTSLALSHIDGL